MTKVKPSDVDIFTDISVILSVGGFTKVSGWGAVIIRADRRGGIVEASGRMKSPPVNGNTDVLEARALANGLHKAKLERLIMPGERVKVWTDSSRVVQRWSGKATFKRKAPEVEDAFDIVRRIARDLGCILEVKHVQGHQPASRIEAGDYRATMNARADYLAGATVKTARPSPAAVKGANWDAIVASYRPPLLEQVRATVARLTGAA